MGRVAVVIYTSVNNDKLHYSKKAEELMSSLGKVDGIISYDVSNNNGEIERSNYLKTLDEIEKFNDKKLVIVVPYTTDYSNDPVVVEQISYNLEKIVNKENIEVWVTKNTKIGEIEFVKI